MKGSIECSLGTKPGGSHSSGTIEPSQTCWIDFVQTCSSNEWKSLSRFSFFLKHQWNGTTQTHKRGAKFTYKEFWNGHNSSLTLGHSHFASPNLAIHWMAGTGSGRIGSAIQGTCVERDTNCENGQFSTMAVAKEESSFLSAIVINSWKVWASISS